jgi:hypothetical protein
VGNRKKKIRAPKKFEKKNSCKGLYLKKLSTQAKNLKKIFVQVKKVPSPASLFYHHMV